MNKQKMIRNAARVFMGVSALSMLSVSLMAFSSPQAVMDLVHVQLTNNDAFSSIRGIYGGVGLTLFIGIVYMLIKEVKRGLQFLTMLWGFYALSRVLTILIEGELGAFGTQWLTIETTFCIIALALNMAYRPARTTNA